jgi:hypothetical protein
VSNPVSLELVTCASCEYRYPRSERICPMCGTEPLRPLLVARNKSSRAGNEVRPSSEDTQKGPPRPGLWGLKLSVVVVLIALMAVTWFLYWRSKGLRARESGAAAEFAATSGQPKLENAGERNIVHDPVGGVQRVITAKPGTAQAIDVAKKNDAAAKLTATSEQVKIENAAERHIVHPPVTEGQHHVTAKLGTVQTAKAAKENDPVELWKAVKRGSVSAELALANLYLEGEAVPRNCEQAHMLLQAASMRGSKAADNVLKSSYAERCE